MLARLVDNLPSLVSLDISGTNLAGNGAYDSAPIAKNKTSSAENGSNVRRRRRGSSAGHVGAGASGGGGGDGDDDSDEDGDDEDGDCSMAECDIPGLKSRVGRPLEFLGLYKTAHEACCRSQIPAKKVPRRNYYALKFIAHLINRLPETLTRPRSWLLASSTSTGLACSRTSSTTCSTSSASKTASTSGASWTSSSRPWTGTREKK